MEDASTTAGPSTPSPYVPTHTIFLPLYLSLLLTFLSPLVTVQFGICLTSIFITFVVELVAFRLGSAHLHKLGISMDAHVHPDGHAHGHAGDTADALTHHSTPSPSEHEKDTESSIDSVQAYKDSSEELPAGAQILGVAMLEFGVIFHSITIGLTLALTEPTEVRLFF